MKIHFHWIWAAINAINDNTYFLIEDWDDKLQVDCWGWKWLTRKIKSWEINFSNLFITHKHTDHILWFFHFIRVFMNWKISNINIYCSKNLEQTIKDISNSLWCRSKKLIESWILNFKNIDNLNNQKIWNFNLKPINLNSKKIEQFWFLLIHNDKKILFFWDEAVWVLDRKDLNELQNPDYLIIESVCPEYMAKRSWWTVNTEKMSHITSKNAWIIATRLNAKNLILIHTMDIDENNRQSILENDAKSEYNWNIIVPNASDIVYIN